MAGGVVMMLLLFAIVNMRAYHTDKKHKALVQRRSSFGPRTRDPAEIVPSMRAGIRPAVQWKDLKVTTPSGEEILKGLTGSILPGQIALVIGPSGAGKSTFFDVLGNQGLRGGARASGTLLYGGNSSASITPRQLRGHVRYRRQLEPLPANLTVKQVMMFAVHMRNPDMCEADTVVTVGDIASHMGLNRILDRLTQTLSGGERSRVGTALALITGHLLTILDEPFSGAYRQRSGLRCRLPPARTSLPIILHEHSCLVNGAPWPCVFPSRPLTLCAALDPSTSCELFSNIVSLAKERQLAIIMSVHSVPAQVFEQVDQVL